MGLFEISARMANFAEQLPVIERTAFYVGIVSIAIGAAETELSNPLFGGVHVILGSLSMLSSVSTQEAMEVLDNRGNL